MAVLKVLRARPELFFRLSGIRLADFDRHSPSGMPLDVKIASFRLLIKRFGAWTALAWAQTLECGQVGAQTRIILALRRRSSARWTDLSCRFRSVAVRIAVARISAALAIGEWRQEQP